MSLVGQLSIDLETSNSKQESWMDIRLHSTREQCQKKLQVPGRSNPEALLATEIELGKSNIPALPESTFVRIESFPEQWISRVERSENSALKTPLGGLTNQGWET